MRIFLSELAENKLLDLTDYLLRKWNLKVKNDFIDKFSNKINQISLYPESCIQSNDFDGLYKCVVTKQTTFYYRVDFIKKEIEIITIFDTRQTPDKLSQDL
ncbi:plasmid stabilization system protein ParE [Flavobacterium arsenatis]|uniref:Plasmid stabilization system protein ParE n=1 Tax=Flavobacterium arsenatis TaxID=1484332 RepID=A0ABU1TRV9_9FLAO|nr:type II toxin-antitoxin system RelE/ParE family toxin [Flavobacterium arsenatis]MDR6968603.1 plasmid stabilization system protein ParE [Flavobacterium arsenatis]